MSQLPHQLCTLDCADGLSIVQPLYHPLGMAGWTRRRVVRLTQFLLDKEMPVAFRSGQAIGARITTTHTNVVWFVQSYMPRFDQGSFYVEAVDFVEHGFNKAFNSVLCGAVGPETRDAQGARNGREDEVATGVLCAEVREGELDDVQGAEKVCVELVAEVVVILVFTCADDAWESQCMGG